MLRRLLLLPGIAAALAVGGVALAAAGGGAPGCAAADRHMLVSARPGAGRELVPPGATGLLLCRYSGLWDGTGPRRPAFRLLVHVLVNDRRTVAQFERGLDSLPHVALPIACPASFAAELIARFRYASGPENPVTIALDGCIGASNGHRARDAESVRGLRIVNAIAGLTGFTIR